jgi:hypothetical protein
MTVEWSSTYLCPVCDASRQVVKVLEEGTDPDTKNPYQKMELECRHIQKRLRISKKLTLKWNAKVSVKPVAKEGVPVTVSQGTSTQIASFSELDGVVINNSQIKVDKIILNNTTYNTSFTSATYDIHDILIQIDNSNYSSEEKEKIKQIMKIVDSEIKSKPLPEIFSSLSNNIKSFLPLATPFIIPLLNKFLSG